MFCNFELWPWWQKRPSNDHGQSVHSFLPFLPFLDTYLSLMSSEYGSLSYLWRSLLTSFWWNILQTLEVKVTLFHPLRSCLHERPSDPGAPRSIWKSQMDTKKRLVFQQNFRTRKYNYIIKIPQVFVRKISMAVSCKLSLSLSLSLCHRWSFKTFHVQKKQTEDVACHDHPDGQSARFLVLRCVW